MLALVLKLEVGVGDEWYALSNGSGSEIETVMKTVNERGSKIYRASGSCCDYDHDHDGESFEFEIVNAIGSDWVNANANDFLSCCCRMSIVLTVGCRLVRECVMCPGLLHVRYLAPMLAALSPMRLSSFAASVYRRIYSIRSNSPPSQRHRRLHPQHPILQPHQVLQVRR